MAILIASITFWVVSTFMVIISLIYNAVKYAACQAVWSISKVIIHHDVEMPRWYFKNVYNFGIIFDAERLNTIIQGEPSL